MSTVNQAFDDLLVNHLTLNESEIARGSKSHNYIRDVLANKNNNDNSFPLFVDGDFLSGSYARGTKIHPLDDIDILMIMDGSGLSVIKNGNIVDAEVRNNELTSNPILQHLGQDNLLSSSTVLNLFVSAMKQTHPESKIHKDGQAINVWLESYNFGIDIVPCFHIIPKDGSQDYYFIPQGGNSEGWTSTNPKVDEIISNNIHQKHGENFKGIVRLLKYWNRVFNNERIRSYHLETIAWYVFYEHESSVSSYEEGLIYFFRQCRNRFASPCPDATEIGGNIDTYLSINDRNETLGNIDTTNNIINNGYLLGMANDQKRLAAWKQIFGDKFN